MIQITRRQLLGLLASAVLLIAQAPVVGQETPTTPLKVLFIGNSYTSVNDLPSMIAGLAEAAGGRKIDVDRHLVGGCTLEKHVKDQKAIDKIRAEKWDVVVLQEQSLRPVIDRQSMHEYARLLDAEVKKQGAKTIFYLTWARQHIPDMQEGAEPDQSPEYAKAMYGISGVSKATDFETWCQQQNAGLNGGLNGAYFDISKELGAGVAPVGIAWKMALAADVLHSKDKSHPNQTGTYLAACVFYATLLDASPVGLPGKIQQGDKVLADIPGDQAKRLQEIAWAAVKGVAFKTATVHASDPQPVRLIFDADMMGDVDDVGTAAVLHALADQGEVKILAMGVCVKNPWSPLCMDALNTYFRRPDIPLGVVKGPAHNRASKYAQGIAEEFPHALKSAVDAPDAALVYRRVLAGQPDGSVVMVSVGQLTNISEIHDHGMYTVRWSRETLAAINPVFKKRCERDGMVLEDYWLGDDDLEPDTGSPLNIEHPTEIKTKPLSPKDQDDRIRMIFGLTSNDPGHRGENPFAPTGTLQDMSEILIVYDTTEGQSCKIAQHVAARRPSSSTCERNTG